MKTCQAQKKPKKMSEKNYTKGILIVDKKQKKVAELLNHTIKDTKERYWTCPSHSSHPSED